MKRMHVISHTHWDREWYQDFQGYRQRMVYQIDRLMDLLDLRPQYVFHFDGQTSWIDDYLEIRPQNKERLAGYIRSGRIEVGPWYTMPDELLLSGESITRNLILGHLRCREYGTTPMPVGYVTDVFAHCSQFPQIMKGFNIDTAFLKVAPWSEAERTEMVWQGADGTEMLLVKIDGKIGYDGFMTLREFDDEFIRNYEKRKIELGTTDVLFGLDGNDHQPVKWDTPEEVARANKLFTRTRAFQSTMKDYLADLKAALGPDWQKGRTRLTGEIFTGIGTGASRLNLKQANDAVEWKLAREAEPLEAWAMTLGAGEAGPHAPQKDFLDYAWRNLILNHPHDSICGCSMDQVHRDMMYRFDQARLVADNAKWESLQAVADRIDPTPLGQADSLVAVFNLASVPTGPTTAFAFEVPSEVNAAFNVDAHSDEKKGTSTAGMEPVLIDENGQRLHYDVVGVERQARPLPFTYKTSRHIFYPPDHATPAYRARFWTVDRYHVVAGVCVPALGYRMWRIVYRPIEAKPKAPAATAAPAPVKADAKAGTIENSLVRLTARPDGAIDLLDKSTGKLYSGIHRLEDNGDKGDGWNSRFADADRIISSSDESSRQNLRVAVEAAGNLRATMRISFDLLVPADLVRSERDGKAFYARGDKLVAMPVETTFAVTAGSPRVECRTVVENTARRHRLRAAFPTDFATDDWQSDSVYDLVDRKAEGGWASTRRYDRIIKNFLAASSGEAGLAVITKGLNEAELDGDDRRTMRLTLWRSFSQALHGEATTDSLLLGELATEYALVPFKPEGGRVPAGFFGQVDLFKLPALSYSRSTAPGKWMGLVGKPLTGMLPTEGSFVEVPGAAAVSCIKTSEDGSAVVVRIFNPTTAAAAVTVRPKFLFARAWKANLLETPIEALYDRDGAIALQLAPKEVFTLRIDLR